MDLELILLAVIAWGLAAVMGAVGRGLALARILLVIGAAGIVVLAWVALPAGTASAPLGLAFSAPVSLRLSPEALWLMGFGMAPAVFALAIRSPVGSGGG